MLSISVKYHFSEQLFAAIVGFLGKCRDREQRIYIALRYSSYSVVIRKSELLNLVDRH